jgi:hypothetical protein
MRVMGKRQTPNSKYEAMPLHLSAESFHDFILAADAGKGTHIFVWGNGETLAHGLQVA